MPGGILLLNKPRGLNSFRLVSLLRRCTGIKKIGHAGTLDPFATGVMVMLIGKEFTRLSSTFLNDDKEYIATLHLGASTDTYDCDGAITATSALIPSSIDLSPFQGTTLQIPPMFSAKKVNGQKLHTLARRGIEIERKPASVTMQITLLDYTYPTLVLKVACSKGTYIRSLAHDLGLHLGTYAHLTALQRTRSGSFRLEDCIDPKILETPNYPYANHLLSLPSPSPC